MASGCSSGGTMSEPEPEPAAGDLATAISQGTVSEEMLERCVQDRCIDVPDKDGQTPLMIACLEGLEDVVIFLLANGANPNNKSLSEGNTPMHYACMIDDTLPEESISERLHNPGRWTAPKISIVKVLLSHGASVHNNLDGWSPACVAALYLLKDVVDFFLLMDDDCVPLEDKIKASEVLGVSQAILDQRPSKDAFHSFCRAIALQEDSGIPKRRVETSELSTCFSKLSLKELHTLEEIRSVESSETALKAHAFLVGERLFPPSLKQRYFFPSLKNFVFLLMFDQDKVEQGFQICSCVLGFERRGDLQLGTVAECLSYEYLHHQVNHSMEEPQSLVRQCARDLMSAYVSVINSVHIDCLLDVCHSLIDSFGVILFAESFDWSSGDLLKSTLQDIEKLLRVIRGRICRERPAEYHRIPSVTLKIMTLVRKNEIILFKLERCLKSWFLVKVRYVLLRILLIDNASYQDGSSGSTLLHMLAYSTLAARFMGCIPSVMRCIKDLALAFVRHGCPLDTVNDQGQTARDILQEIGLKEPNFTQIEKLLSPSTTVLQLQEAAARVVLQHKINYQDILPLKLHEIVEGFTDSDLERLQEDSDITDTGAKSSDSGDS